MTDAFILDGARCPSARYGSALSHVHTDDLLDVTMNGVCERSGTAPPNNRTWSAQLGAAGGRTRDVQLATTLPIPPLTSFIGRGAEVDEVAGLLTARRLVTLSGEGGVGKTRLAIHLADRVADSFADGVFHADLASIANPEMVAVTVARGLGLADVPGRPPTETVLRFVGRRQLLVLLENCEHLLGACAELVDALLRTCPNATVFATSREPIGVAGELTWRVPPLSLNEAVELFADRARLVKCSFHLTDENVATITEICRRLDGMPLAIELAAARVRALSPTDILSGLQDRFGLLTGGARTMMARQQTLRASMDWSHALLSPTEAILLRRLAVFKGGFQLDACEAVVGGDGVDPGQILDLLTRLVDKSLVVADDGMASTRYRLLETVREYAIEKLSAADEADSMHARHRDFYTALAAEVDDLAGVGNELSPAQAAVEMDNYRAAFVWSQSASETELALKLASSLQPLWLALGRVYEGLSWFDTAIADGHCANVSPMVRSRALADRAVLRGWTGGTGSVAEADLALTIARECGDQALLARAVTARGIVAAYHGEPVDGYFAEASELARAVGDRRRLCQILGWQTNLAYLTGDPIAARTAAAEGSELADAIGDRFTSRQCGMWGAWAHGVSGDLTAAVTQFGVTKNSALKDHDMIWWILGTHYEALVAVYRGDAKASQAVVAATLPASADFGAIWTGNSNGMLALAALAAADLDAADKASHAAWEQLTTVPSQRQHVYLIAEVALARGDLTSANHWADEAVSVATGWYRLLSLTTRSRIRLAGGDLVGADADARDALALASNLQAYLGVPDALECLAAASTAARAARLFGAAEGIRRRLGIVRFRVHDEAHGAVLAEARNAMGHKEFDDAFAEGCGLATDEALAYALRGKGERKRPATGWAALTPAERDIVRLVCDGLSTKDIAKRQLVSPRTVQTHLTHVYTKLSLNSRVLLVQEASRHEDE